jgi:hypothetical protein
MINHRSYNLSLGLSIISTYVQITLHLLKCGNHHSLKCEKLIATLFESIFKPVLLILECIFKHLHLIESLIKFISEVIKHL